MSVKTDERITLKRVKTDECIALIERGQDSYIERVKTDEYIAL